MGSSQIDKDDTHTKSSSSSMLQRTPVLTLSCLQDQVQDVLDAMFERTVECGDYVIRQGDDGDNFYVIDRY